ncbi:IS256 family transposase [Arthrobacter crystallopoietes]|jgi:putative transposase|uniref:IS256 family transposase n=1 Tax=Crystallibacter crystallopoietes TaxID=37928 RepID=UPI001111126C|nr:IS256 family transposase [Arthrobacter crystallopoietes]QTG82344.1 IS256 family transposase [Arthrobacter crystallopoietes]
MIDSNEELSAELAAKVAAAGGIEQLRESGAFDELMEQIDSGQLQIDGKNGFLNQMIKAVLERGLQAELSGHLGYEKGDPAARLLPNARNGSYPKTLASQAGDVGLDIPRDRNGSFTPQLVPKGSRRTGGLDEMIISLYAGGMTIRDIQYHLESTIGTELSHETISKITDDVLDEVLIWQRRPLDPIYPVLYLDAIMVKIRDGAQVRNKAAHIAVGVDMDGIKHVLGIWVEATEGAKFWAGVCAELANRGVKDVLIVCCDGLTGFPEAIAATWPLATVQTCVVHLIRASLRFIGYQDRKKVAAALRPIYTASTVEAAEAALEEFAASPLGTKYRATVNTWRNSWEKFIPFLAFPPPLRRVIYTTNAIESLNYQLRKIIKNRGHFPNDNSAVKLLWLAICNIEDKRARERSKLHGKVRDNRSKSVHTLIEGSFTQGWSEALGTLALAYPERIEPHLN